MEQHHDDTRLRDALGRTGDYLMRRSSEYREAPALSTAGTGSTARRAWRGLVGVGAVTAVAVTALVMGSGAGSPAWAWSPTPTGATPADEENARSVCAVNSWGIDGGGEDDDSRAPGSQPAPSISESDLPEGLPALTMMDARGNGVLAVFSDSNWIVSCMLRRDGDGFERGPVVAERLADAGTDNVLDAGVASTLWSDGTSTSMINGVVPAGAESVELVIPGQPTGQASVSDGRFSIWWIGAYDGSTAGTIRALDADGVEVASVSLKSMADPAGR
ncbi:MAG: hypothetical protein RLZ04_1813 [Actinomycetota bacterium]